LRGLLQAPVTRGACDRALSASRELAGRRRLPAADYLIASSAAERGFAVLHYDRHFDLLCPTLGIDGVAVAPLGELGRSGESVARPIVLDLLRTPG
jgi:predicted nucleic acid-binding protein